MNISVADLFHETFRAFLKGFWPVTKLIFLSSLLMSVFYVLSPFLLLLWPPKAYTAVGLVGIVLYVYLVFFLVAPQAIQRVAFNREVSLGIVPSALQWRLCVRSIVFGGFGWLQLYLLVLFFDCFTLDSQAMLLAIAIIILTYLLTSYGVLKAGLWIVNIFDSQSIKIRMSLVDIIKASLVYHVISLVMLFLTMIIIVVPIIVLSKIGYLDPDPNIAYDLGPIVYYVPLIILFLFVAIGYYFNLIFVFFSVLYKKSLLDNRLALQARI